MSAGDLLLQAIVRARPADPTRRAAESSAVRILARVAVLEADGTGRFPPHRVPPRSARSLRWVRSAAAGVAAVVAAVALGIGTAPPRAESPSSSLAVDAALRGDPAARARVLAAGADGRAALIARAAEGEPRALALLASGGGVRGDREADAVAALVSVPAVRERALDLLARSVGSEGPERLRRLLEQDRDGELAPRLVVALRRVATGGRTQAAVDALVGGARAGSVPAAVAGIELGRAPVLDRILASAPDEVLTAPAFGTAVRDGTPASRLVRLVEAGHPRALLLAASARLEAAVPALLERALSSDPGVAEGAVALLERIDRPASWLALARCLEGTAWVAASDALARLSGDGCAWLRRVAASSPRDRPAALAGLYAAGVWLEGAEGPRGGRALGTRAAEGAEAPVHAARVTPKGAKPSV